MGASQKKNSTEEKFSAIKNYTDNIRPSFQQSTSPEDDLSVNEVSQSNCTGIEKLKHDLAKKKKKEELVPITFEWNGDGKKVYITGSFCGWTIFHEMIKDLKNGKYYLTLFLMKGKHEYKFLIDGEWKFNKNFPTINNNGNINNFIDCSFCEMNNTSTSNYNNEEESKENKVNKYTENSQKCSLDFSKIHDKKLNRKPIFYKREFGGKFNIDINDRQKNIGKCEYLVLNEKNILSSNYCYKNINRFQHEKINHLLLSENALINENISSNHYNTNKGNNKVIKCSVPIRFRNKSLTLVYYKEYHTNNNSHKKI